MGADPLAWMNDDSTPPVTEVTTKPVERRRKPRAKTAGLGLDIDLLEQSFAALAPQGEALVKCFYAELFERYPDVKPMFDNTTVAEQEKKLLAALQLVVNSLRDPKALVGALTRLGSKHHDYGARPEHYTAVSETLLDVMAEFAGELWTADVHNAWSEALNTVATTMLAAKQTGGTGKEDKTMAASKKMMEHRVRDDEQMTRLQSAVDGAMTAIMMIDRDFNITYANPSTFELLRTHEAILRSVYPGFRADATIGSNIDIFHANPAHQRQLLSNPNNLPYKTDISIGSLKFELNVTAQIDPTGNYIGNTLEWSDVTEIRAKEAEVSRLQSAVDGAQSNLMLCDADLNIVYANPAVVKMLRARQIELRQIWPSLDVDKLVGTNIDGFHKNPAHQRALLSDARRLPAKAEIKVDDLEFQVNATMITGPNGEYMGNMVEWKDITEEKNAERQIQSVIDGVVAGQMDNRISTNQFEGFLQSLGEGINRLMDAITEPVQETRRVISGLAEGDLTQSINGEFQGEFAELRDAVNATMSKLLSMVEEIGTASGTIASAANEISQGTADLSQRSEEQASSLEETASSMEELTGTVRQNADNAREANQLATSARDEATKGGEVVGKAITAMAEINQSSKKIADIIGVIDEIAFQTNLLALNAAVEAARAGEQGRGFAVVAAEVRNLAQRSASAAKEIKSLINDSVEKVTEGSKLVDQSGATLEEIVTSVKKVSDIIAEIASAGQEQASGIDQINKAVTQMDEMTQQNAALVEEAAASSESMNDQAAALDDLVGFFNTGENNRRSVAPPASTRHAAPKHRPGASPAPRKSQRRVESNDDEWEEF
ncbi:MAG: PAS domain-containing protein [Gammaproteobacteria bacterium]|nr:PAS domain-containing protein [Gammaproteobacteria bacterium]